MPIFIDDREPKDIIIELKRRHLAVEIRHLESSDYCFGEVGIERKTIGDLYSSAMDRRLWAQLDTLRRTYKIPIILIEDYHSFKQLDKITQGILTTLVLFWKQQVIFTFGWLETAKWLEALFLKYGAGKSGREPPAAVRKYKTTKEITLEMLQCVAGIGPTTARRILEAIPNIFGFSAGCDIITVRDKLKSIKGLNRNALERLMQIKST